MRIPTAPLEAWMPVHYGYEVQIDNMPELSGEAGTGMEHYGDHLSGRRDRILDTLVYFKEVAIKPFR